MSELTVKERPIIFNSDMIRAILNGSKTQSRRVIVPQPFKGAWNATSEHPSYGWLWKKLYQTWSGEDEFFERLTEQCPYGQIGQRVWVRETWATEKHIDKFSPSYIGNAGYTPIFYKVDNPNHSLLSIGKWRPSIFMPRWASRITLEITEVRVERLQKITGEDAMREGVILPFRVFGDGDGEYYEGIGEAYVDYFHELWDSLNAKRKPTRYDQECGITEPITLSYDWSSNPWVWVVSFKVTQGEKVELLKRR